MEKGKEVPNSEACTFGGVDKQAPFPSPCPGGRKGDEKAVCLGSREHHFHVICKQESRITECGGQVIYIYQKR